MARLEPLSLDQVDGLEEVELTYQRTLGFVPNGLRIMARRPEIVQGFIALRRAVLDPASGTVPGRAQEPLSLTSPAAPMAACTARPIRSRAPAAPGAEQARLEAVWEYRPERPLQRGRARSRWTSR